MDRIINSDRGRSAVIASLRGWAILSVMIVHTCLPFKSLGAWSGVLASGARGVQLFFILSAITLLMSWHKRHETAATGRFFVRRFFRIAPMFYLAIILYWLIDGYSPRSFAPDGVRPIDYAVSFLFLNGWVPNAINSIVPGGWSIGVEASFYLLFPWLVLRVTNLKASLLAFVLSAVVGLSISFMVYKLVAPDIDVVDLDQMRYFLFFWPSAQMPVFMIGFAVFYLCRSDIMKFDDKDKRHALGKKLIGGSLACLALLAVFHMPVVNVFLFSFAFAALFMGLELCPVRFLVNRPLSYMGNISYSAYFVHFFILRYAGPQIVPHLPQDIWGFLLFFPFIIAATVLVSSATYFVIEKQWIIVGNKLAMNLMKA